MTIEGGRLPCKGCIEYECPVATIEPPDVYFDWILTCYSYQQSGFRIENDQLSLDEWRDIGIMRSLLEARREHDSLSSVGQEMLAAIIKGTKR